MLPRLAVAEGAEYPVVANEEGIKLKTEKMVPDQLYHVIHDEKVFLFYKDEEGLLHCYEVENTNAVKEIVENPSQLESILKKYAHPG
jgi:hypothetical protein